MSAKDRRFFCLLLLLCLAGLTKAAEPEGADSGEVPTAPNPCHHLNGQTGWIDRTHDWLSRTVCGPSRWVDGFFAGADNSYSDETGTELRVIGSSRWQDDSDDGSELKVRAHVDLPNAQDRLSLVFENRDNEDDVLRDDLDTRPEQVGNEEDKGFRGALRIAKELSDQMDLDFDVGVRSELTLFAKARYRWQTMLPGNTTLFRFTEKGYWEDPEGFGASSLFEFDRPVTRLTSLRLSSEYEITEANNELGRGWYYSQFARLYMRLGKRSGISYAVGFDGYTQPKVRNETYRTSIRFRRSIWRPWFFYEIEPYVFWPRRERYHGITGIVLRIEMQAGLPEWEG